MEKKYRYLITLQMVILAALMCSVFVRKIKSDNNFAENGNWEETKEGALEIVETMADEKYIKWVEFHVTAEALNEAYRLDCSTYKEAVHLSWIELLAYVAAKSGGRFDGRSIREIQEVSRKQKEGKTMEELTKEMQYYDYYLEAYTAVLGGMVGEYEQNGESFYGLKAFLPIAKGFDYSHYDDFGSSRSYGYARPHLGHDMMGMIGTPIIAIESGYVEVLGWNQYGGWRIGIRSFDGKRYYYYAHLRQNYPYAEDLKEGDIVTAGEVIGYMGHTGYSTKENVNNIKTVHLHWGLQLIFDESQKEGNNEIWIDCYELTKFLSQNRSEVQKVGDTREWKSIAKIKDPEVEKREEKSGKNR